MSDISHIRHSLAHLLAKAVKLHFPKALPTIGPDTDTGFYYDFDFLGDELEESDLKKLESEMKSLLPEWETFSRIEVSVEEAKLIFTHNRYKLELIEQIETEGEQISLYYSGPKGGVPTKEELLSDSYRLPESSFLDLCRGGHVDNPAEDIDSETFQLDSIAGAYWRGDENNKMLTRIYGLAFDSSDKLEEFLHQREEAKKRDHRKLGKELDLFTFSDLIGPGLPLFTPKGALLRDLLVDKIHDLQADYGYQRVAIPHISKKDLFETSGHWDKFGDELFKVKGKGDSDFDFVMKPMNCPLHTQIYDSQMRSYRDLPIRYTEATMVYRDEQAGELLGLSRVRAITQDDGHVFCTMDQAKQEITNIIKVIEGFYSSLDMWNENDFWVSLSVRDPETPDKYLGDDEKWDKAEQVLREVADENNLPYTRVEGEAAFYGPKLDFMFKDALGREWQLGTAQYDLNMPSRFGLTYIDSDGKEQTPVMIHRAIAGSLERFLSVIIEHFAGSFPFWLSPTQVTILPIAEDHLEYAQTFNRDLSNSNIRSEVIPPRDSLGKRIRSAKKAKVPYIAVVGDSEVEADTITLESRDDESHTLSQKEALSLLEDEN